MFCSDVLDWVKGVTGSQDGCPRDTSNPLPGIAGCYQIDPSLYSTEKQNLNDWHFVQISWDDTTGTFTWLNNAGVSWALTPIPSGDRWDTTNLAVGPDCPYYYSFYYPYKFASLEWEGMPGRSTVLAIKGPGGEPYLRKAAFPCNCPQTC